MFRIATFCIYLLFISCEKSSAIINTSHDSNPQIIPLGGNAWATNGAKITENGLENWTRADQICKVYFKVNKIGNLKVSLFSNAKNSKIQISIAGVNKSINFTGESETMAGEWEINKQGYVELELKGIDKQGLSFAEISAIGVSGSCINLETSFVKNNEGNYFYWGRRGPSVHLNYNTDGLENIEWFYSEITVPEKNDVMGSYYMANGFKEGYFGMQVNSETERRVLFSIWSPFTTDDPTKVPNDQKILLLKKGDNVYTGEFGNEGAGGQSYLKFNWKTGNTYKFLVGAEPAGEGHTTYSAYFFAPEEGKWRLVASFNRPKTNTYLKSLYSFLENFTPETGNLTRQAYFGNQWAFEKQKGWVEINKIVFSADATARIGYRKDYAGGRSGEGFFLKNCGFFDENTMIKTPFEREIKNKMPQINFSILP
ncbi:DUF3472 domain-containing protein [Lacihabitans sp. CS3-21]|uniref:DUF3472 domain-containing protein n=1 Tax=Lacihabitans sp. CS3-21 TaxID=2487332 RepID=UPI0020CF056C|nr:DUF3472 domain-containing protein [Lacihabitans sp. CS3-21]MCP9749102.1 DUF3472 domain-containing protein [Lacihabitans sp. CS3-21]